MKKLISFFASCLALLMLCSCITNPLSDSTSITTEKPAVIKNAGNEYYIGSNVLTKLNNDNSVTSLDISTDVSCSVYDGNAIYAKKQGTTDELYKYTFDGDKLNENLWVSNDTLSNGVYGFDKELYTDIMTDFKADEEYIYFVTFANQAYFMAQKPYIYRLGRISKSGSSIEFIGNSTASAYTIHNGWIYFYDNGYTCESSSDTYSFDYERSGIYKMKTDGSEKQLLLGNFETPEDNITETNLLCGEMNIIDEYLYYVNYSNEGDSRLYRMNTDGNNIECITKNGVHKYTIDSESQTIYYSTGKFGANQLDPRTLYKVSLDNKTEEKLTELRQWHDDGFAYYNGYLYFIDYGHMSRYHNICGARYNLKKEEMDILYKDEETSEGYYDEDGFFVPSKVTGTNYYWELNDDNY